MADIYHALGLHMHQPLGNLVALHNSDESWEARQILWCYDRPVRMLEGYEDRSEEHTSELQSLRHLVCRLLLEKKTTTASPSSTWVMAQSLSPAVHAC